MSKKDLKYYLSHTDEMPTDPVEIEKLANEHMAEALETGSEQLTIERFVTADDTKVDETSASSDAKTEEAKEEPVEEVKTDSKPEGVLAKDGKNVIPYGVLASARERAEAAEQLAAEQAAEIERLKSLPVTQVEPQEDKNVDLLSDAELDALAVDSPTLAKVLRSQQNSMKEQQAIIQKLNGTVENLAERQQAQIDTEVSAVKDEIQEAIDANPTLAEWQVSEDQSLWNEASRIDKALRESPTYKDVPFEKRFAKVVELTKSAMMIDEDQKPEPEPKLTQKDVKALAAAKLKTAKTLPKSLSDVPGGAEPAVDERARVEEMSAIELGNKFLNMTPEQIDAYLASL